MKTDPYWIAGPWQGKLAIISRPRGGDWLNDEMLRLRRLGIDHVVSLLTPAEETDFNLADEGTRARVEGLEFHSLPIPDRAVPLSREEVRNLAQQLLPALAEGRNIALHCRQGIGRSAVIAACLLSLSGVEPREAFERIGLARGCSVPETKQQSDWVLSFTRSIPAQSA